MLRKNILIDTEHPTSHNYHIVSKDYIMAGVMMKIFEYGNPNADTILIQPVDDHDMEYIENEVALIKESSQTDFRLIAVKVDNWNNDLSPWKASAVFGNEDFGGEACRMLEEVLKLTEDKTKTYYIGGYSLAGLFALWAAYQTDVFLGVVAASPSIWFPGFVSYMKANEIKVQDVYLSLGDKEERAKNPTMATVGDCIREAYAWLNEQGINVTLEWNQGNHFKDADVRTAKGFVWVKRKTSM